MARIYISSTFTDLQQEREAVAAALRQLKHEPIGMEDYVAEGSRPLAVCLRDVAGCDGYVGIFGFRYGYVPPDDNPEQRSITELEYRTAKQEGIETMIFLQALKAAKLEMADKFNGDGNAGQRIEALRRELQAQHTVLTFEAPDDLQLHVSGSVSKATADGRLGRDRPLTEEDRRALGELRQTGLRIVKLYAVKFSYQELLDIYLETRVLRSERAQDLKPAVLRAAVTSAKGRLHVARATVEEWNRYLSEKEKRIAEKDFTRFSQCIDRLEVFASAPDAQRAEGTEASDEIVEDFTRSLVATLNDLDALADTLWKEVRLDELRTLLARFKARTPEDFLGRVQRGYSQLMIAPPLHSKCDILVREHDLLDEALSTFSLLRREIDQLDIAQLRIRCKAIRRKVEQARAQWQTFLELPGSRNEPWEVDLLGDGSDQWEVIDKCEAEVAEPLRLLEGEETEVPSGLLDKLRRAQKFLEQHFKSVDKALVEAYERVKIAIGDDLLLAPGTEGGDER